MRTSKTSRPFADSVSLEMTHGAFQPKAVDPAAERLSPAAETPWHQRRRAWLRTRLPMVSPVVWLTSGRVTQQALSLILFAVLAPILGPRPYGLFALVMVFVGFCEAVLLEGAVEALVTVDDLDHLHTTTANRTNGLIALALGLAMFALAPAIAAAMHDAEIRNVMWALAPMPVLTALSAAPIAVLRRSLKFKELAIRSILGLTIGGVFGIVLAVEGAGFGPWCCRCWGSGSPSSQSHGSPCRCALASPGRLRIFVNSVRSP